MQSYRDDFFAWEQCKLSDISEKSYEKNTDNKYSTVLTNSAEYGIVKQRDFFDKDIANSSNISGYYVVRKNYFVYNPRISNQAKFGPINRNKLDETGVMSPLYLVFTVHDIDEPFLETLFQTTTWHRFMYQNGDTGARADRFAIKDSTFMSMPIKVPTLEEQHKLALAFQKLDHTITLHEEKKRQLERIKSALLQKMFADKSGYPSVRYKGFDEMWEYCKLEEVFVERNQKEVADANYPLCSFIAHKGVVPKDKYDRSFLVKSDGKKYKRTEINDFIYSSNNLETGSIGLNKFGRATISPVYSIFMVKGDSDFIAGLASTPQFIYEMIRFRQGVVYGQWRIHESDFLKIKYYIPQVTEQEKIGNLLSKLTHAIILHERKLKLLSRVKQSLLQKMFI